MSPPGGRLLVVAAAAWAAPPTTDAEEIAAFARLYGVVRWFHPSDEAARADWDALALAGVPHVRAAEDRDQLARALLDVFGPVAPTFTLDGPPTPLPAGPTVAWQHLGLGDAGAAFASRRTERGTVELRGSDEGAVSVRVDAAAVRGREVRLSAAVHLDEARPGARAGLFLRTERADGDGDTLDDQAVRTATWEHVELRTIVAPDAAALVVGGAVSARGTADFVRARLEVADPNGGWTPLPMQPWRATSAGWTTGRVTAGVRLAAPPKALARGDLFAEHALVGEVWTGPIGAGLVATVPLALPSVDGRTWPAGGPPLASDPGDAALADAVVAWSAIRWFSPVVEGWDGSLDGVVQELLAGAEPRAALERWIAQTGDGRAAWVGPPERTGLLPARLAEAEGHVLVVEAGPTSGLQRGDELVTLDGAPVRDRYAALAARAAGSPQWIAARLLDEGLLTAGPAGSNAQIGVLRDGAPLELSLPRDAARAPRADPPAVRVAAAGVWVVDLTRATPEDLDLPALAAARAVVFDLRGAPLRSQEVLRHLLSAPDAAEWTLLPRSIGPDRSAGWDARGWRLSPAKPHLDGRAVFLADGRTSGGAEAALAFVERYHLGDIVGSPSAGATGAVADLPLPSGAELHFTAARVLRADGTPIHARGVPPTVPVSPTAEGIRAGRDELLEAALALIEGTGRAAR